MSQLAKKLIKECLETQNTYLEIGKCGLSDLNNIPELFECTHLETLILSNEWWEFDEYKWERKESGNKGDKNMLSNLPSDLSKLKNLKKIVASGEFMASWKISNIDAIKQLTQLNYLDLRDNQISHIEAIKQLTQLNYLDLSNNQISHIEAIKQLTQLNYLYLSHNQISNLEAIKQLTQLNYLYLSNNQISNIEAIKQLTQLNTLILSDNQISHIDAIKQLTQLNQLYLSSNQISDLSPLIDIVRKGIVIRLDAKYIDKEIVIGKNPLANPPVEIIEQGNEAVLRYFDAIKKEGSKTIHEAKVTLVGEGNAGKTTLLRKLLNPNSEPPQKEERTRGICIEDWEFDKDNDKTHIAHIWDFGGQDVYYPVHRFFLTENSVFVLLASTRQNTHEFNYWIPTIFQFGGKSPIILAQTCHDGNVVAWNDIGAYVANDNFNIIQDLGKRYHELNLLNGNQGLDEIRKSIIHQILHLPHINKIVPASWIPVREMVKNLQETNCIAFSTLKEKIQTSQPDSFDTKEDFEDCIQFFHSIGILLWYRHESKLKDWVILNPKWAVDAVYKIIDDETLQNQKGVIYDNDFVRIWHEVIYDHKHEIMKQMLEVFKIAFPKKSNARDFIIPTRLESMPSEAIWHENQSCLRMEYNFEFMPKGMVNQISAELSRYIVDDNQIWNNGVNFKHERAKAQVFEDFYFRKIYVKAKGDDARSLMLIIMNAVKDISDGYKGVLPKIYIPCPCAECQTRKDADYFNYDNLLEKLEKKTNATITCKHSDEVFEINKLLSTQGLPNPIKERREAEERQNLKTIKIFLASSNEMEDERDKFRNYISTQNDRLHKQGIYLEIVQWEHYLEDIVLEGKQNQLNEEVKNCDMVLCLFSTKVGAFTTQEFEAAMQELKENGKVKIYTYFENRTVKLGDLNEENTLSLFAFKKKLNTIGHFNYEFENSAQLHNKFKAQLERYLESKRLK